MDAKALPKTLYKYRSWDDKYHRHMLWHNEIYFASPKDFNDPFDSQILLQYERMTFSEQVDYYANALLAQTPGLEPEEARSKAEKAIAEESRDKSEGLRIGRLAQQRLRDAWGVFTATTEPANILLWSHYASEHKGFCVGLDTARVDGLMGDLREKRQLTALAVRVEYCVKYPALVPNKLSDKEYFRGQFGIKYHDWKYEREWRLLLCHNRLKTFERTVSLDPQTISEVILGCAIPPSDEDEIKAVLRMREHKPKLFRAVKKELEFGLDIVPIDY
jgi:hypothetical protein